MSASLTTTPHSRTPTSTNSTRSKMGIMSRYFRIPRPRTFLYVMDLRTGVELISLSMIFNKVTGFYGILAILTGFRLSPLQFSMYLYSLAALALIAFLMPHIRKQSPFECLALAYFYLLDTIINTAFTSAFAVTWLLAVSADNANTGIPSSAPGSGTISDTAGFTSPKYNVSSVDVIATPAGSATGGQDAVAYGTAGAALATATSPSLGHAAGIEESIPSIMVVVVLTVIRIYFILVVMSYARQVLRQHMFRSSKIHLHHDGTTETEAENPFAADTPEGEGWRGKLGRMMVKIGKDYWLGGQADDDAWVKGLDGRFKNAKAPVGPPGTVERERRARSGTGPPVPPPKL